MEEPRRKEVLKAESKIEDEVANEGNIGSSHEGLETKIFLQVGAMICPLVKNENEKHDSMVVEGAKMTKELLVCQGERHEEEDQQEVAVGVKEPAYGVMSVARGAAMNDKDSLDFLEERHDEKDALVSMKRDSKLEEHEEWEIAAVVSCFEAKDGMKNEDQIGVYFLPMGGNQILWVFEPLLEQIQAKMPWVLLVDLYKTKVKIKFFIC
jgi:hypothetical protein